MGWRPRVVLGSAVLDSEDDLPDFAADLVKVVAGKVAVGTEEVVMEAAAVAVGVMEAAARGAVAMARRRARKRESLQG